MAFMLQLQSMIQALVLEEERGTLLSRRYHHLPDPNVDPLQVGVESCQRFELGGIKPHDVHVGNFRASDRSIGKDPCRHLPTGKRLRMIELREGRDDRCIRP